MFLGTKRDHNITSQNTTRIIQKLCTQCATALGARAGMVQAHTMHLCNCMHGPDHTALEIKCDRDSAGEITSKSASSRRTSDGELVCSISSWSCCFSFLFFSFC